MELLRQHALVTKLFLKWCNVANLVSSEDVDQMPIGPAMMVRLLSNDVPLQR